MGPSEWWNWYQRASTAILGAIHPYHVTEAGIIGVKGAAVAIPGAEIVAALPIVGRCSQRANDLYMWQPDIQSKKQHVTVA